eukprot:TRINITY_DN3850_c0_g1_i2.p1 TRINITY_DN3850_c0_g1~~TRINITY_DN3850_c0_g1_i2.p1  ORF type:complete len:213 (-),score=37.73 TRINITY_DN3850_c0_g1_i2:100-738(-)
MRQQTLIYSFIAKGGEILAEYTSFTGNFSTVAVQCLQKLPSSSNKFAYTCDGYTFNFLLDNEFVFLVVADEAAGRHVPFLFLERVKEDFEEQYGKTSATHDYGPKLKEHMQYCMECPEELSKVNRVKAQALEVKGVMMDNIEKVLEHGERIELLVDKSEGLQFQAHNFQRQGRQVRRKIWLQNFKSKLVIMGIVIIVLLLVWLSVCNRFSCH